MTREERNQKKQKEITWMEKKEKVKKTAFTIFKILFILILIVSGIILYSRFIATSGLIIKEHKITSEKIPDNFHGFKVIQFSDLHYGSTIFQEQVNYLVDEINLRKPDLVVFTGDLIDKDYSIKENDINKLINSLKKIEATVGKYAVTGNHDYKNKNFNKIMIQSGFTVLDNTSELIYYEENEPILLVGLSSSLQEKRDIDSGFAYFNDNNNNNNIFTINLLHEPDSIDNILSKYPVDLALSGHSHNGQIRIPFIGSIVKIKGAKKYSEDYYKVNNTDLYVSGGIGTSTYPFRLFNHPSINFFRITKS